jgi:hypothetical protein
MTNDRCRLQISANKNTARASSGEMLPPLIDSIARRALLFEIDQATSTGRVL